MESVLADGLTSMCPWLCNGVDAACCPLGAALYDAVMYISNCRVNPAPREFDCISLIIIDECVMPSANEKAIQWSKVTQLATVSQTQRREV